MLTKEQEKEIRRVKGYYPFRIVFAVIDKNTGEFSVYVKTTMHTANKLARKGHKVYVLK